LQVLEEQSANAEKVMQGMAQRGKAKHVYAKQMGKFVNCIERSWLSHGVHVVCSNAPRALWPTALCFRQRMQFIDTCKITMRLYPWVPD
jgi:hypothetical protein